MSTCRPEPHHSVTRTPAACSASRFIQTSAVISRDRCTCRWEQTCAVPAAASGFGSHSGSGWSVWELSAWTPALETKPLRTKTESVGEPINQQDRDQDHTHLYRASSLDRLKPETQTEHAQLCLMGWLIKFKWCRYESDQVTAVMTFPSWAAMAWSSSSSLSCSVRNLSRDTAYNAVQIFTVLLLQSTDAQSTTLNFSRDTACHTVQILTILIQSRNTQTWVNRCVTFPCWSLWTVSSGDQSLT